MKYKDYNDFELISYIKEQNEEANEILYTKYKPLVINIAKKYYTKSKGYELSDFINEGMLGVFNAILSYNENLNVPFYSFVKNCVENNIYSLLRSNVSPKNKILNESISYDNTDEEYNIENIIGDNSKVLYNLINIENINELKKYMMEILTSLEYQVFIYKLDVYTNEEIANILKKDKKTVENALCRIKKKLKDIYKKNTK